LDNFLDAIMNPIGNGNFLRRVQNLTYGLIS
jgi:hypothetical protein